MALKPTRQRRIGIQPVGTVSMSGLRQLGDAYESIANESARIGKQALENQYQGVLAQAKSDAEILARTTGAKIDDNGRLMPYVPVSVDDIVEGLRPNDAASIRRFTEELSKTTWLTTVYTDAFAAAGTSLINNPDNPSQIISDMNAYNEGIANSSKDAELLEMAKPDIARAFAGSVNKAQANLKLKTNEKLFAESIKALDLIDQQIASSASTDLFVINKTEGKYQNAEALDLISKRDGILNQLYQAGLIDQKGINARIKATDTTTAVMIGQNALTKEIEDGGFSAGLELILSTQKGLASRTDIDVSEVVRSMTDLYQAKANIFIKQKQETSDRQNANYGSAYLLAQDGQITADQIMDLDVTNLQKSTLKNVLSGAVASKESADKEANEIAFDAAFNSYKFSESMGTENPQKTKQDALADLVVMAQSGKLTQPQLNKFFELRQTELEKSINENASQAAARLDLMMGPAGGYLQHPEYFFSLTDELREKGIVGEDASTNGMTNSQWSGKLNAYTREWEKNSKKIAKLESVRANKGIKTSSQIDTLDSHFPSFGDINSPTTGEEVLTQSIALSLNENYLHKDIRSVLTTFLTSQDEDYFNRGVQIYNKFVQTASMRGMSPYQVEAILRSAGVTNLDIANNARLYGFKNATSIAVKRLTPDNSSVNRTINSVVPDGMSESEYFTKNFEKAFGDEDHFIDFVTTTGYLTNAIAAGGDILSDYEISQRHKQMINDLKSDAGLGSLKGVVLENQFVLQAVQTMAYDKFISGNYNTNEGGFQTAIRDAFYDLGDNIGISLDENGKYGFVLHPVLKEAQKTVGSHPVTISHDDLVQDINIKLGLGSKLYSPEDMELLEGANFTFHVNKPAGPNPTYTVVATRPDQSHLILDKNYRYDFKSSMQNEVFSKVMNELKDTPSLYRLLANTGMFGEAAVADFYRRANNAQQSRMVITEMLNFLNQDFQTNLKFTGGMPMVDPNEFTDESIEKFFRGLGAITGIKSLTLMDEESVAQ